MKRNFSLRTMFLVMTLASVCCAGASDLVWFGGAHAEGGKSYRVYLLRLSIGAVDRPNDGRGQLIGAWWERHDSRDGKSGTFITEVPIVEFER